MKTVNKHKMVNTSKNTGLITKELTSNLTLLLDSTDQGIFEINLNGIGTYINKAAANMLGYTQEDLLQIKDKWHNVIHYSYEDGTPYPDENCYIYAAFDGKGCHIDNEVFWRRNGTSFPVEYSSFPIFENGKIKGAVVTFRDITWRLEAEKALRTERDKYHKLLIEMQETQGQLIESEKMAVLGTLVAGIAHEINTPLGAINASISNIDHSINEFLQHIIAVSKTVPADQIETFINLLIRLLTENNNDGIFDRGHLLREKLQNKLEMEQIPNAAEIADTLIDMGIFANAEELIPILKQNDGHLLLEFGSSISSLFRNSKNIADAVKRASKIVFALKSYSHYQIVGEKTREDVRDDLDVVLTLYQNQLKQGVKIIKNYNDVPPILAFHDELNQAFSNIIHNALYAMKNEGTLTVDVLQEQKNIIIKISDTGHCIPPEIMPNLFKTFFTTKAKGEGSGLGLSIVKKIIDKHHGTITAESKPGKTTFTITLPIEVKTRKAYDEIRKNHG